MLPLHTSLVTLDNLDRIQDLSVSGRLNIRLIHVLWDDSVDRYVVLWESTDPRLTTWISLLC